MEGLNELSEIERLKILKSIRLGCKSDSEFNLYLEKHSGTITPAEAKRRIDGLFLEDEFALLCRLMGTCTSINNISQSISIESQLKIPDYIASFKPGCSLTSKVHFGIEFPCFIEVKTTTKAETNNLSATFIEKYKNYTSKFSLPLLFASRLKINEKQNYWIIQNTKEFEASKRKASINELTQSIGHILLDDFFITSTQDILIEKEFTPKPVNSTAISPNLGYLNRVTIHTKDKKRVLQTEMTLINLILDCFAQKIIKKKSTNKSNSLTTQINFLQSQLLSDILLRANCCIADSSGNPQSNATKLLLALESGNAIAIDKNLVKKIIQNLNKSEMLFMFSAIGEDPSTKEEKLISAFKDQY